MNLGSQVPQYETFSMIPPGKSQFQLPVDIDFFDIEPISVVLYRRF